MSNIENSSTFSPQFDKRAGLLPVVVQDSQSLEVLMLGYANEAALKETIETKLATFWSTSRNELWTKGKTSGDYLEIIEILTDCDQDALIYKVKMAGIGTCHSKNEKGITRSKCFYREIDLEKGDLKFLEGFE